MQINATILGQLISFFLFVMFCMKYIWPSIISSIEKRQKIISDGMKMTEQAKKELEIAHKNAFKHIEKAKEEAKKIINEANKIKLNILTETKKESEIERKKIINNSYIKIESERFRMKENLKKDFANLVIIASEKIIERKINLLSEEDIINKFIAKLK